MTKIRSRDSSRIQDRRGQGGGGLGFPGLGRRGGGTRLPLPGGKAGGGGLIGLLVIAAIIFLPRLLGDDGTSLFSDPQDQIGGQQDGGARESCQTEAEQIVCGAVNHVSEFWIDAYPQAFGEPYQDTDLVFFSGGTTTGCGPASSQTGPFYCPADAYVYIDLEFMALLQERFGAEGDLAAQYIVAHEFGHHVQNLTGQNAAVQRASGETQRLMSIALELQADCYAGAWAASAENAGDLEPGEISEALNAAAAVGDDAIQRQTQGRVDPESWTHGSSAQREQWFRRGFETGDPLRCDTFAEL